MIYVDHFEDFPILLISLIRISYQRPDNYCSDKGAATIFAARKNSISF